MAAKDKKSRSSRPDAEPPTRRKFHVALAAYLLWIAFLVILAVLQRAT